jgi:hypothetical protein
MSKIKTYALGFVVLAIATPIYMKVKHQMAEPAGATCTSATKCRGNNMFSSGMCLEDGAASYCTHECSGSDDCGTGMSCEAVDGTWTEETTQGMHATQIRSSQGTKNVCIKPT